MKTLKNIIVSMRPEQWTKNVIVFAGPLFAKKLSDPANLLVAVQIFLVFGLVSSASYIVNDILDRREDAHHPDKRKRPIAHGTLKAGTAMAASLVLAAAGLAWSWLISAQLFVLICLFLLLHIAYDLVLKHVSILDVFAIAFAFIIRLLAGVSVGGKTYLSSWILMCTLFLALFLALCKRRAEMVLLVDKSSAHRKSLGDYNVEFMDQLITIAACCSVLSYSFYVLLAETVMQAGLDKMRYTIPFVVYGIFRYLYLVHMKKGGSNPEKVLIKDMPFLINMVLYVIVVASILYYR